MNFLLNHVFGWLVVSDFQQTIRHIPFLPQLLLCILVADLAQYWTHRAYHEVPYLWRYHAVHHSAKTMDWLAGSRQHMFEVIFTRVCVLAPLFVLGFSEGVMNAYIIIVGFQAVFNHANVHLPWGPLKYLIVTPDFHHWHHSQDDEAIDRNYAAHYAFLDYIFGTAVKVPKDRPFPAQLRRRRRLHAGRIHQSADVSVPRETGGDAGVNVTPLRAAARVVGSSSAASGSASSLR